jgi:hypothetical protein
MECRSEGVSHLSFFHRLLMPVEGMFREEGELRERAQVWLVFLRGIYISSFVVVPGFSEHFECGKHTFDG